MSAKPKRDRRARATGRLGVKRGERFALIHEEVMNSAAYAALPDYAKAVLFALACRSNGHNNGDLSLPFSAAKQLGIGAQWKLYAGIKLLKKADLIDCTRQGLVEHGRKVCSLYAVTWRGIDEPPPGVTFDAGIAVCPVPRHDWAKWTRPDNWKQIVKEVTRANHGRTKSPHSTTLGNGRSTTLGAIDTNIAQQPWVPERALIAPTVVDTSKTQGWGRPEQLASPPRRVRKSPAYGPSDASALFFAKLKCRADG